VIFSTRRRRSSAAPRSRARHPLAHDHFHNAQEERKAIREELNAIDAARDKAREQTTTTRAKLGKFHTVDAVESEIARVERTLGHTTMPIQEEKKMVNAIKDLTKSKELVREYQEMAAKVNAGEERRKLASERVKAKDAEITAVKAAIATVKSSLEEARSREEKSVSDVPAMQEERNACYEIIKAKREEIRKLRASFKKKEDQHWASEKIWRAYAKYEKQKQYEASAEERKARDEARKKWERENAPEPFEAEVTAAEQLIAYLAKWDPMGRDAEDDAARAAAAAAAAAEAEEKKAAAFEGLNIMNKKMHDDDDDDLFSLGGSSVGKKGKKKGRSGDKSGGGGGGGGGAEKNSNERLNISFDAYSHFAKLSLTAPQLVREVPETMNALREKKDAFLEKRRAKKARIEAGLDDDDDEEKKKEANKSGGGRGEKKDAAAGAKRDRKKGRSKGGAKGPVAVTLTVADDVVTVELNVEEKEEEKRED
jgi:uncharacterized coiled-coil DUF342 family protein